MFDLKCVYTLFSAYFWIQVSKSQTADILFNHVVDSIGCVKHIPTISYHECLKQFESREHGGNVMVYKRKFMLCSLCYASNTPTLKKEPGSELAYFPITGTGSPYENLAQGKPTNQSTTYPSDTGFYATSDLAVDGIWDSDMERYNNSYLCALSVDPPYEGDHWWRVDLENTYTVSNIVILNRWDCCWIRFKNITVSVGATVNNMDICGHYEGPGGRGEVISIKCVTPISGQYVEIRKPKTTLLQICEVAVYR